MNGRIMLYALSTCNHCAALRRFLEERALDYQCIEVDRLLGKDRRDMLKEVRRHNPRCSFPTVVVGETVIVGFKEDELAEALGG